MYHSFTKNFGLNLDFLPNITCRKRHFLNQFIPWPLTVSVSETKSRLFQLPRAHDVPVKFWKFKSNRCDDFMLNESLYLVAASFHESNLFQSPNIARGTTDSLAKPSVSCCQVGSRPFLSYAKYEAELMSSCQQTVSIGDSRSNHQGCAKQSTTLT